MSTTWYELEHYVPKRHAIGGKGFWHIFSPRVQTDTVEEAYAVLKRYRKKHSDGIRLVQYDKTVLIQHGGEEG